MKDDIKINNISVKNGFVNIDSTIGSQSQGSGTQSNKNGGTGSKETNESTKKPKRNPMPADSNKKKVDLTLQKEEHGELSERNTENLPSQTPKRNPWTSGSFFLVALVVIAAAFAIISAYVPWYAFPIILIAAILAVGIVGALQLRNDEGLTETNFMGLILETYKRLLPLKQDKSPK